MVKRQIPQASFLIFGTGRSGLAAGDFFAARGGRVLFFDQKPPDEAICRRLKQKGYALYVGDHIFPSLLPVDHIIRSPGVRPDHPLLCLARERGAHVATETEWFASLCPATLLAVTGSDGKTTTATLLAEALRMAGKRAYLGGNIGHSLLAELDDMTPSDFAVLELSSFQLMDMHFKASGGILTNLTPNHLNWHKDMAEYQAAKCRLWQCCAHVSAPLGLFDSLPACRFSLSDDERADVFYRDGVVYDKEGPLFRQADMRLCGMHNMANLMAVAACGRDILPRDIFPALAASFTGVPHRMHFVGRHRQIDFFDSSIDTTPSRTAVTLSAMAQMGYRPVVLLGGAQKGLSFAPLLQPLRHYASFAVLFGEAADELAQFLQQAAIPCQKVADMQTAFALALGKANGGAVLLSPACTSFDAFRDFEERGDAFCQLVEGLPL